MDSTIQVEQFVDANTVAVYLKITRRQVLEMTRSGILPGYPLGTGSSRRVWRFKLSEVDACVTAADKKKSPEAAFRRSDISIKISSGSPQSSRRRKL
jgi:excisionase family DNA binding protein